MQEGLFIIVLIFEYFIDQMLKIQVVVLCMRKTVLGFSHAVVYYDETRGERSFAW